MGLIDHFLRHMAISTDSRSVVKGDLFFALKGDRFDGNTYAKKALEAGASLVVIDDPNLDLPSDKCFLVNDVLESLQDLARQYRSMFDVPVLAITGSNGKTTTKELVNAVLAKKYLPLVTQGNFNNHIGVPLTLLSARSQHDFFIIEMGANHQGEINFLSEIALPTFGMITNIGKAHLEGFGGIEGVKLGKSELYRFLNKNNGTIFCNGEDEVLISLVPNHSEVIFYNTLKELNLIGSEPTIRYQYKELRIETHLFGDYNLPNIAAAIAIGEYFKVPDSDIHSAISEYMPNNNRSQIVQIGSNKVIKDAYNANPSSLLASLKAFINPKMAQKQMVIIGDMLELGDASNHEHQSILEYLSNHHLFKKVIIGPQFYQFKKDYEGEFYQNVNEAAAKIDLSQYSDLEILLKGSRGISVEKMLSDRENLK